MNKEKWKISYLSKLFEVSDRGRVRRIIDGVIVGQWLETKENKDTKSLCVTLYDENLPRGKKNVSISSLVGKSWGLIPKDSIKGMYHKDGDYTNNSIDNLIPYSRQHYLALKLRENNCRYLRTKGWLVKGDINDVRNKVTYTHFCGYSIQLSVNKLKDGDYTPDCPVCHANSILKERAPQFVILGDSYTSYKKKVEVYDTRCNKVFYTPRAVQNFLYTPKCPYCDNLFDSYSEVELGRIMKINNIKFVSQYTIIDSDEFTDRVTMQQRPFDFGIISDKGTVCGLVEYYGETAHYTREGEYRGRKGDLFKQKYCKEHGIPLLILDGRIDSNRGYKQSAISDYNEKELIAFCNIIKDTF